jgi:hypothetical protein
MDKAKIRELALANGFKLKEQPDGTMELNPYVYEFASALMAEAEREGYRKGYERGFDFGYLSSPNPNSIQQGGAE